MADITYNQIISTLEKKQYSRIYLLMGEDPFYIDQITNYIENNIIAPENRDFNQVVLYGKETDVAEILANVREYPFGSPFRLVIVKEAKELKNIELLKSYAENPIDSAILVLAHKYGKAKKSLVDPIAKNGTVFTSDPIKDYKIAEWIEKETPNYQLKIKSTEARLLAEHIGNDLSRIHNEFQKLQIVLPPGSEITQSVIEDHIGINKEYNFFELNNAFGERNIPQIYKITYFFANHQKEFHLIAIINSLNLFFTKLMTYHLTPDKGTETLKKIFGENRNPKIQNFIIQTNVRYAQQYSLTQLKKIIALLSEYDLKAKGVDSNTPSDELLKELIYKILH